MQRSAVRVIAVRVTIGYSDIFLLAPNGLNYMNYLEIEWQLVSVTILSVPKGVTVTADHCMELTPLLSGEASSSVGESTNFLHLTANCGFIVLAHSVPRISKGLDDDCRIEVTGKTSCTS